MFSGFCAVSGSPTRPGDYTRYRLTLPLVGGGGFVRAKGFMYYCCWPCVCDTQDFIRVDTKNVTLAGGETRRYHFAVVGNPCTNEAALRTPFVQPFYGRGETTLAREAPEVRCIDGVLEGATLSDHGFPIISMFFGAQEEGAVPTDGKGDAALVGPGPGTSVSSVTAAKPQPGRISTDGNGVLFQDETEYAAMCLDRAANGYNSGMGEIFRKVASIAPIRVEEDITWRPQVRALEQSQAEVDHAEQDGSTISAPPPASRGADNGSCGAPPPPVD